MWILLFAMIILFVPGGVCLYLACKAHRGEMTGMELFWYILSTIPFMAGFSFLFLVIELLLGGGEYTYFDGELMNIGPLLGILTPVAFVMKRRRKCPSNPPS